MSEAADLELARTAVKTALDSGCSAADVVLVEDEDISVEVRDGVTERVQEACSRGLGIRAFRGTRVGIAYTNNVTTDAVRECAQRAAGLAEVGNEDPHAGLPAADELGVLDVDLDMDDPAVSEADVDHWAGMAQRAEAAALASEGIAQSGGARTGGDRRRVILVNSNGFEGARVSTVGYVVVTAYARGEQDERQLDHWQSIATHLADLEDAESVGREAVRRAVARCGFRQPPSGAFPVVFSPEISIDFSRTLAQAASASGVYRGQTFLADKLGQQVGVPALTLVDDPTLPRHTGSKAFDGEGVRSRRTVILDEGRLNSWLADSYSARRCGVATTGNAGRGIGGAPGVSPTNLVLEPGSRSPEELIGEIDSGLYITELFGMGVNLAAGTWSRGGAGRWIENGELVHPVQELTVAGELEAMLMGVREVANDLTWRGSSAAPTLRMDGLTVAAG